MKIAIEAQRIFRTNKHGMDFVALESIRELQKIDHENEYFIFVTPGEDRCLEESENVHIIELKCPTYPLWEQVALPRAVKKIMPDLLHCTSNTAPLQCPVPLILTLHDIIYLEKRHSSSFTWYQEMGWFYRRMVVPRVLANCEKIITVSQFERERILDVLHLPKEQLVAVYNGFNSHFHVQPKAPEITRKYIDADNYLFFLGNTDPKKNTPRVLKAYSDYLKQSTQKLPLLIADLKEDVIDRILEEENITIAAVAGTSIGSAVASLYAMGYTPDEMLELFRYFAKTLLKADPKYLMSNIKTTRSILGKGILSGESIEEAIQECARLKNIQQILKCQLLFQQ